MKTHTQLFILEKLSVKVQLTDVVLNGLDNKRGEENIPVLAL